jgi:UDPglucose 6-dehydrogenase
MSRIFIMGSGVVGTATGMGFVEAGHHVTFVDILQSRIDDLHDHGLDAVNRLDLTDEEESFIFLTLPTPNVGHAYDLSAFTSGTEAVGRALAGANASHTVVVRSTVPPGTTSGLVRVSLERESGKAMDNGFCLASNPEFLRAASAREDFRWPWMTVIGSKNRRTCERLAALLTPFGGEMRLFDNPATAEFVKCANNIYNAAKISFWNEMWLVARDLGLDDNEIASTVAKSAEASWNPSYGLRGGAPYGGVCLPKDTKGFLGFAAGRGLRLPLLESVVGVNSAMERLIAKEIDVVEESVQVALPQPAPEATVTSAPQAPRRNDGRKSVSAAASNGRTQPSQAA